ncbi:hypothetical protein D3C76_1280440 [compost metagenome]
MYFLLIGTISSRMASFGACSEIASATSIISPSLSSAGTTPEVESVTRRLDRPKPKSSSMISIAGTTLVRFSSGSPIPIITTLVIGRVPVTFAAPTIFAARQTWPMISDTRRLRLKPCCAVEQNLHSSAQPTWEETHSVARSSSGI